MTIGVAQRKGERTTKGAIRITKRHKELEKPFLLCFFLLALCLLCTSPGFVVQSRLYAQQTPFPGIEYPRGQDVSPTFDGWEGNPDGSFSLWFGYFNRNTEE